GEHAAGDQCRLARKRQAERLQREQHEHERERPVAVTLDQAGDRSQRRHDCSAVSARGSERRRGRRNLLVVPCPLDLAGKSAKAPVATTIGTISASPCEMISPPAETEAPPP